MLSLQASYAAPLILLAQNRQTDRDRVQAEQDRQRSERNLADTEFLAREMAALRIALSEVATRDFVRSELRNLLEDLAAERGTADKEQERRPSGEEGRPRPRRRATGRHGAERADLRWAHAGAHRPADSTPIREALTARARPGDQAADHRPRHGPLGRGRRRAARRVGIDLTTPGCPLKDTLTRDVQRGGRHRRRASTTSSRRVRRDVGRAARGAADPAARHRTPSRSSRSRSRGSLTKVFAIASGKGGVGKSSVTANLAVAMAADGLKVGIVDADIYGFSIPRMLGVTRQPTRVDDMLLPPEAFGVLVVSIGMFVPPGQPVVWRGPMLHRALQQFLADVFWGDLDVLLLDLPPGTGDIAISVAQLLPSSEIVVVTTPQVAAAEVAERAGSVAVQTRQHVVGVVENMSWLEQPDGSRLELFGSGGGQRVADNLSTAHRRRRPAARAGARWTCACARPATRARPWCSADPDSPAAQALRGVARVAGGPPPRPRGPLPGPDPGRPLTHGTARDVRTIERPLRVRVERLRLADVRRRLSASRVRTFALGVLKFV